MAVAADGRKKSYLQDPETMSHFKMKLIQNNREHHPIPTTHHPASKHQITSQNTTDGRQARVERERSSEAQSHRERLRMEQGH